jgi:L-lactate dehydrogenase
MKVTVVGTGNVGAALLFHLTSNRLIDKIGVMSRKRETATAAILDVASAHPEGAAKMAYETADEISQSDVIVITAGVTQKGKTAEETYGPNLAIARAVVEGTPLKDSAIVVCIATPVDYLTVDVQRMSRLPRRQVIGFGGDLDSNRLKYILRARNCPHEEALAVGEHGPNAVAVYPGEHDYAAVTEELHQFWLGIARHVDIVRNLATADLLARLVHSIITDAKAVHNVCAHHPDHGMYLTWPHVLGRQGAERAVDISLLPNAATAVEKVISTRQKRLLANP